MRIYFLLTMIFLCSLSILAADHADIPNNTAQGEEADRVRLDKAKEPLDLTMEANGKGDAVDMALREFSVTDMYSDGRPKYIRYQYGRWKRWIGFNQDGSIRVLWLFLDERPPGNNVWGDNCVMFSFSRKNSMPRECSIFFIEPKENKVFERAIYWDCPLGNRQQYFIMYDTSIKKGLRYEGYCWNLINGKPNMKSGIYSKGKLVQRVDKAPTLAPPPPWRFSADAQIYRTDVPGNSLVTEQDILDFVHSWVGPFVADPFTLERCLKSGWTAEQCRAMGVE